jgi:hypothetical protein
LAVPAVRPSFLDTYLRDDFWIDRYDPESLTLFAGDRPLAAVSASSFDVVALNQVLFALRSRNPRRKPVSKIPSGKPCSSRPADQETG